MTSRTDDTWFFNGVKSEPKLFPAVRLRPFSYNEKLILINWYISFNEFFSVSGKKTFIKLFHVTLKKKTMTG